MKTTSQFTPRLGLGFPAARMLRPRSWPAAALCAAALTASQARADAVLEWNILALRTTASAPFNPPLESRNLAIVHAAMADAVNSIAGEFQPYISSPPAPMGASAEVAAAAAAHHALARIYPAQQAALDAAYQASLDRILDGAAAKEDGARVGVAAAEALLCARAADGAAEAIQAPYAPGSEAGAWIPTPPAFLPAMDPGWGSVVPFVLRKPSQFRPKPPPALGSRRYAEDFDEIRQIGSAGSAVRTPAQTDLARAWIATGPQNWNPVARAGAEARRLTLSQNARLFALLNLAGADAFIAAWDAKYAYSQWRPVTAIRAADQDGNPATPADDSWTPLLVTPPFPDYIAGHTAYAGAAARVLAGLLGDPPGTAITLTSPTAPGVTETYETFEAMAAAVVDARVWGGIHWRTSCTVGREVGERIGRYAIGHYLRSRSDHASCDADASR